MEGFTLFWNSRAFTYLWEVKAQASPTIYRWTYYNPYKWPYKSMGFTGVIISPLLIGVISPLLQLGFLGPTLVESISWFQVVELFPGLLETLREPVLGKQASVEFLGFGSKGGVKDGNFYIHIYISVYDTYIPYIYIAFSVFKVRSAEKRSRFKRWPSVEIYTQIYIYIYIHIYIYIFFFFGVLPKVLVYTG